MNAPLAYGETGRAAEPATYRPEEMMRPAGVALLAIVASIGLGVAAMMIHTEPRPAPPRECYSTRLGSTGFCTHNQYLNLIEWLGWTLSAAAALLALIALATTVRGIVARTAGVTR